VVDLRTVGECRGHLALESLQIGLQGTDAAVELAVGYEAREVRTEIASAKR
jgi:hypothetical protein